LMGFAGRRADFRPTGEMTKMPVISLVRPLRRRVKTPVKKTFVDKSTADWSH
jgi:hypothetical protein